LYRYACKDSVIRLFPSGDNTFLDMAGCRPIHVKISANVVIVWNPWFSGSGAFPGLIDISTSRPAKEKRKKVNSVASFWSMSILNIDVYMDAM